MINYTFQDLLGSFLATVVFPIVLLIPGYVIGWWLNVFEFRNRRPVTQHIMGIVLSNAISPIALFLLYRFTSAAFALLCLFLCLIAYLFIVGSQITRCIKHPAMDSPLLIRYQKYAVLMAVTVVVLPIALLVDIQIRNRLYFSAASFDLTTRVAVVDAITRTGVPPINPGYFPGHPVQLNYLYYFWYILGSVVDQLGGNSITAYHSMIGSVVWSALTLLATLALYIRLRTGESGPRVWHISILAAQLLMVSGLDFIPVTVFSIASKLLLGRIPYNGRIESWNIPIMSWMNAINWVPHHVASALSCIAALMLFMYSKNSTSAQRRSTAILTGLSMASAFGLSVWVTLIFAIFWGIWMIVIALKRSERNQIWIMFVSGILGLIFISPFLLGILQSNGPSSGTNFPISLYIRPFMVSSLLDIQSKVVYWLSNLLFLPLNYFFEFGLYFVIAILWLREHRISFQDRVSFITAETILVVTTTIFLSFFYSNIIAVVDLGIRGWLPMQFVLVIWAVELIRPVMEKNKLLLTPSMFNKIQVPRRLASLLSSLFIIGILTSTLELIDIRTWPILVDLNIAGFPNELSPDTRLGERTFAARSMYDYIHKHIASNAVIQSNPLIELDRPGGLYGDHQMAIADRTAYGVSADEFKRMTEGIGKMFELENISDWKIPDDICTNYSINIIIVNDIDPLWSSLNTLALSRPPIYKNEYYAVFACGQ